MIENIPKKSLLCKIYLMRILIAGIIIFLISINTVKAETLVYKSVLEKAVKNSYDLKISQIDVRIAQTEIKEARSEYFPLVSLNYNSQYDKDLTGGTSSLTPVGDSIVANNTRYLNALSAGLQYNLFDFGVRKKKLDIAKKDKLQKQTVYTQSFRDLKLNLSDVYTKTLLLSRELKTNEELLSLNKTLFSMYEKLYNSGTARKTDMTDQALKVAVLINKIDDLKTECKKNLSDISFYTKENYTTSAKILNIFDDEEGIVNISNSNRSPIKLEIKESEVLDINNLPEYKQYQLEIEKKKAELSMLKRQNLPQFRFTTNYYFYGTDKSNYFHTFGDMEDRSLTFRVSSVLPVFDGLKNQAQREKAKLEIERLALERDKKVESVKSFYEKAYDEAIYANQKLENQANALKLTEEKIAMIEKLNKQQLIDKISYLKQKADLISQKFEFEKTRINSEEAAYKLRILAEVGEEFPAFSKTKTKIQQKGTK
ncbi:MAG: hypothetical protein A2039_02505 [Candidatus Melainabacteria bacterium GWA2_34_9]|nr:MAG: hypothetical protein A2039_02505 [Candidatus Melainabacteria bacterium GWA2_34_9]